MDEAMASVIVDQIYNLTARMRDDYINPTANGVINWRSICSYDSNNQEAF
jgi:hypothetical protein